MCFASTYIYFLISVYPPQGNVRWFTWAEVAFQLERKLDASIAVVNQVDDFAADTRSTHVPSLMPK
jgi:hypothetical protein